MNINMVSIDYAYRLRLRNRLTLGRLSLPRNPWAYGEQVSHLFSHYSFWHNHFQDLHGSSRGRFVGNWNAPLPINIIDPAISADTFSPVDFQRRSTRPVSYYALFKWWLPLSQHPGCFCGPTSLIT